jgi:large subunit ribosomal protein L20
MSRVKRGTTANKRRNYLLKRAKGFNAGGKSTFRLAKQRLLKADTNAYISRRLRKRDFRQLWISRINGALDAVGSDINYSKFIGMLNNSDLNLNRKMISEIAIEDLESFKVILKKIQETTPAKEPKTVKTTKAENKESTKESTTKATTKVTKEKESIEIDTKTTTNLIPDTTDIVPKTATKANHSEHIEDLKIVEGIGPAIEKLLHEAGIKTYSQLADSKEETLKEILSNAGSNFNTHDPVNWAKQSSLAASGKFEELEKLKDELINGK